MIELVGLAGLVLLLAIGGIGIWRQRKTGGEAVDARGECAICGRPATHYRPIVRAEARSSSAKLHGLTPRYVLADDEKSGSVLCEPCRRWVERKKENRLASVRARTASFNDQIEQELALIENGGVELEVRQEWEQQMQGLQMQYNLPASVTPLPLPASQHGTMTLAPPTERREDEPEPG